MEIENESKKRYIYITLLKTLLNYGYTNSQITKS